MVYLPISLVPRLEAPRRTRGFLPVGEGREFPPPRIDRRVLPLRRRDREEALRGGGSTSRAAGSHPDFYPRDSPGAFPKKGTESCGAERQWCGRLGKVDTC